MLYADNAKEVHIRSACPPLVFGCKYLNFSASRSEMDLIARQVIIEMEGKEPDSFAEYCDPGNANISVWWIASASVSTFQSKIPKH